MTTMINTVTNLEYTNLADMLLVGLMVVGAIYQIGMRSLVSKFDILMLHFVPAFASYITSLITGVITVVLTIGFDMYYSLIVLAFVYLLEAAFMVWDVKAGRWFAFTPSEQFTILRHPTQGGVMMYERKEEMGLV